MSASGASPTTRRPYASGSRHTDAVIVCPCSMASIGSIAGGIEANLIHRAAAVQLKEGRRLVARAPRDAALRDPPREPAPPEAGGRIGRPRHARLLPPARSIDDLVDFVASRILTAAGVELRLTPSLGVAMTLPPDQVREMFDRISPSYDRMNRLMSIGMDGAWRSLAVRASGVAPGDAAVDVCCGTGDLAIELLDAVSTRGRVVGLDFSQAMLDAARAQEHAGRVGARRRAVAPLRRRRVQRGHDRLRHAQPVRPAARVPPSLPASSAPAAGSCASS